MQAGHSDAKSAESLLLNWSSDVVQSTVKKAVRRCASTDSAGLAQQTPGALLRLSDHERIVREVSSACAGTFVTSRFPRAAIGTG